VYSGFNCNPPPARVKNRLSGETTVLFRIRNNTQFFRATAPNNGSIPFMPDKRPYSPPSLHKLRLPELLAKLTNAAAQGDREAAEMLHLVAAMATQPGAIAKSDGTAYVCPTRDHDGEPGAI